MWVAAISFRRWLWCGAAELMAQFMVDDFSCPWGRSKGGRFGGRNQEIGDTKRELSMVYRGSSKI